MHSDSRKKGNEYHVETVNLKDLLDDYSAPRCIDYLSIDTEGSEYEILKNFNFNENISQSKILELQLFLQKRNKDTHTLKKKTNSLKQS